MQFDVHELDNLKKLPEREDVALRARELLDQAITLLSGLEGWHSHHIGYSLQDLRKGRYHLQTYVEALKEYEEAYKEHGGGPYIGNPPAPALDRLLSDEDL